MGLMDRIARRVSRVALLADLALAEATDNAIRRTNLTMNPARCWWCVSGLAESAEHRYPRSVFRLVHGRGGYAPALRPVLTIPGDRSYGVKSDDADAIKYKKSMCGKCNNARSQPLDRALSIFARYVLGEGREILKKDYIDFGSIYGESVARSTDFLIRALAKDFGCRICSSGRYIPQVLRHVLQHGANSNVLQVVLFKREAYCDGFLGKTGLFGGFGPTVFEYRYVYEIEHVRILLALRMRHALPGLELVDPPVSRVRLHDNSLMPFALEREANSVEQVRAVLG